MPAAIGKITNLDLEEYSKEIDIMAIGDIHHITQLYNLWMQFCTQPTDLTEPNVFEIVEEKAKEFRACLHKSVE